MSTQLPADDSRANQHLWDKVSTISQCIEDIRTKVNNNNLRYWTRLLGDRLVEMLRSRDLVERAFNDANPRIREGAFSVDALHWKPDRIYEEIYRRATLSDPDPLVRATALACLVGIYRGSANDDLGLLLAEILKEESNPLPLRKAAFLGIHSVQGAELSPESIISIYRSKHVLPEDLDWSIVNALMARAGK